jgi:AraC-like DNA-binding protein
MVCARCIRAVEAVFVRNGIAPLDIRLGEVIVRDEPTPKMREALRRDLEGEGFELLDDKKRQLIEQVKVAVIELVHHGDEETLASVKMSEYLQRLLRVDYGIISALFSQLEGITLEKYVIHQKIERVKELMMYNELRLGEIAHSLGYSSVHHLSNQFKRVTGMTPTEFKQSYRTRRAIDTVGRAEDG